MQTVIVRGVAYSLVGLGVVLWLATALHPQLTGAFRLAADILVWGLMPYVVYGVYVVTTDSPLKILLPGLLIAGVDLYARWQVGVGYSHWAESAMLCYGPPILALAVFPLGWLTGVVLGTSRVRQSDAPSKDAAE